MHRSPEAPTAPANGRSDHGRPHRGETNRGETNRGETNRGETAEFVTDYAPPAYGGSIADAVDVAADLWPGAGERRENGTASAGPAHAFAGRRSELNRPSAGPSVFSARPEPRADESAPADDSASARVDVPDTWDIREAFLNLAAGRLTDTARNDAARAHAFLDQYGFEDGDAEALGFGLYPDPAEVEEHLRRCGFPSAAVHGSGLTRDGAGDLRSEWEGRLVLPVDDETGRCVDLAVIDPAPGPHRVMRVGLVRGAAASGVVAYGLSNALREQAGDRRGTLVLTEDLLDACLLNARGFGPVAAIGGEGGAFTPRRWEELSRLGIGTVTLAFREDDGRHDAVRDCLVHALRARTAPEVYVLEPTGPADCETLAETVRVRGVAAAEARLHRRTLAFHGKDFGAAPRTGAVADWAVRQHEPAPAPKPKPAPQPRFRRDPGPRRASWASLREKARAEMLRLPPDSAARRAAAALFAEVDSALAAGDFARARDLLTRGIREPRGTRNGRRFATTNLKPPPPQTDDSSSRSSEQGRSWFTAPGRTDGYARGWSYEGLGEAEGTRKPVAHTLAGVLDGLASSARGPVIPDRLHGERCAANRPGTVTALTAADPAASLAAVCDRLADVVERDDRSTVTVVLRHAAPGAFAALLVTHLTGRLSSRMGGGGKGLTAGEVDARLAGRDAAHRYAAKPWLADEAADRLRSLGDRVTLVDARRADLGTALNDLERAGKVPTDGGLLCDAADAGDLSRLADFAARTGCWCVAATAPQAPVEHVEPVWRAAETPGDWSTGDGNDDGDDKSDGRLDRFRSLVGEWIDRAGD